MSDQSVHAALRSSAPLVLIEAPAGCGKTHHGSEYAADAVASSSTERVLVLTHTHAACSVFAIRTKAGVSRRCDVRTIDGFLTEIAKAYCSGLALPADILGWLREQANGHAVLAQKVATLVTRHRTIAGALANRYPVVVCDEHQDSSGDQHAAIMALNREGAKLRIFSDPMQRIFRNQAFSGSSPECSWADLTKQAHAFEKLETPHRWAHGCPELGALTLKWRAALKDGAKIDLRGRLPPSVTVVLAENEARANFAFQAPRTRAAIDRFEREQESLLVLTRYNETARSLRSFFNRRIPLWEGHTRPALDTLVRATLESNGNRTLLTSAVLAFLRAVGKGFGSSEFGTAFEKEIREGCTSRRRGKPAAIQELARHLLIEPDHRGVAKMLGRLAKLRGPDGDFGTIALDNSVEYQDAVRLGEYEDINLGLAEITSRRSFSHPQPPRKAISTVHKAKGLECDAVIVVPCDAKSFPDREDARRLLYVALSRAKQRLLLVIPPNSPSPLFAL